MSILQQLCKLKLITYEVYRIKLFDKTTHVTRIAEQSIVMLNKIFTQCQWRSKMLNGLPTICQGCLNVIVSE